MRQTKPTEEDLAKSRKYAQYHIYDMYSEEEFEMRMSELAVLLNRYKLAYCYYVITYYTESTEQLDKLYEKFVEAGYEGQMVRISEEGYENKRSKNLLKRKEFDDNEFEIISVEPGKGNRAEVAGSIRCRMADGREFGAGVKGSFEYAKDLLINREKYIGGQVTVQHFKLTPDGIPRFPVAKHLYEGKRNF